MCNNLEKKLEDYLSLLKDAPYNLIDVQSCYLKVIKNEFNDNIPFTLFLSSIINRAISLNDAFVLLAEHNNYIAAISLVRLQLDNILAFYSIYLVADKNAYAKYIIDGNEATSFIGIEGKPLRNSYVAKKMKKLVPNAVTFYKDMCGYIHLSKKFIQISACNIKEKNIEVSVGQYDFFTIEEKVHITKDMYSIVICLYELISNSFEKQSQSVTQSNFNSQNN